MKSAYELAMERLQEKEGKASPPLTEEKKQQLAKVDERFKARIAEREVFLQGKLAAARAEGKFQDAEDIQKQLVNERSRLEEEREREKDKVRNA